MRTRVFKPRRLLVAALTPATLYLAVAGATRLYVSRALTEPLRADQARLADLKPRILADMKLLTDHPIFETRPREKNAERFVSGFISWESSPGLESAEHERLISLMHLHENPLQSKETWTAFLNDPRTRSLDLAWVDQLSAYDHIGLATHPFFDRDLVFKARYQPDVALKEFRFAALARAAQLTREHRVLEAANVLRHLAELASTTDSLSGAETAAFLLLDERNWAEWTDPSQPVVDLERIAAFRRTARAWAAIDEIRMRSAQDDETTAAFHAYFARATNACAPLFEMTQTPRLVSESSVGVYPLEPSFDDELNREIDARKKLAAACEPRADFARNNTAAANEGHGLRGTHFSRLPFVRRILAVRSREFRATRSLTLYEQNPREPASSLKPNSAGFQ